MSGLEKTVLNGFLLMTLSLSSREQGPQNFWDVPIVVHKIKVRNFSAMAGIDMHCERCLILHFLTVPRIA